MNLIKEQDGLYHASAPLSEEDVLSAARTICAERLEGATINSPTKAREVIGGWVKSLDREMFGVIWLDTKHRVVEKEVLFYGTLNCSDVYPREVVKAGLRVNAWAVILVHCHPSMCHEPSSADEQMTIRIQEALALVDIQVLDHIVAGATSYSMAEGSHPPFN